MYHFIYPSKDAYIYELNTNNEKNFGGDDTLVLKKDFDVASLNGVSRVLLQFDLSELSSSIVSNKIPTDAKYYLRLYERKTSELSPKYSLATFPLSSSWENGSGYTEQNPNSRNGVSWLRTDESFDSTNWSLVNTSISDSGSRTTGGGVWITGTGYECSQSFSYESPDVNMDVSDIVNNWLDNSISNNGLILKWSGSQEGSTDKTGEIEFYSFDAASVYSPRIEARWSELTYSTTLTELTTDGTKDNYLYMIDLRKTYRETETVKFRVGGRERYQTKSASTTKSTSSVNVIPNGKGWYSILDVETGDTLIPFGDNSKLSADNASSYFKLNLNGFITNRLYRIVLRLQLTDGRYRIFDDSFDFRVVN